MITKLNHVSMFVLDQASAFNFYANKPGFNDSGNWFSLGENKQS
jgi:hypothetical protein